MTKFCEMSYRILADDNVELNRAFYVITESSKIYNLAYFYRTAVLK